MSQPKTDKRKIRRWTKEEEAFLEEKYAKLEILELCAELNRTYKSVIRKAEEMGLMNNYNRFELWSSRIRNGKKSEYVASPIAWFVAGYVAGEGSFHIRKSEGRKQFGFTVGVGIPDKALIEKAQKTLRCGHIYEYSRQKEHWEDTIVLQVLKTKDLYLKVIPFFDKFLIFESRKLKQYEKWKGELLKHIGVVM